jgi:hypothetical protein
VLNRSLAKLRRVVQKIPCPFVSLGKATGMMRIVIGRIEELLSFY